MLSIKDPKNKVVFKRTTISVEGNTFVITPYVKSRESGFYCEVNYRLEKVGDPDFSMSFSGYDEVSNFFSQMVQYSLIHSIME